MIGLKCIIPQVRGLSDYPGAPCLRHVDRQGMLNKKTGTQLDAGTFVVARTRFELVISALRGRRPEPLDERAICTGPKPHGA